MNPPVVVQAPAPQPLTGQTVTYTFPLPVGAGNLLMLQISWAQTLGTISQITDSLGSVWQQVDSYTANSRALYTFAAKAAKSGTCTITIPTDTSRTYTTMPYEVNGALTTLDGTPAHTTATSGTVATTGSLHTSLANSIIFVLVRSAAGTPTVPGAPWVSQSINAFGTSYQVAASPGNYSATWTVPAGIWATSILAFAAGGPSLLSTTPSDNASTLLAKGNKLLGGTGTTPSDNEFTLLAKQFRLLGGAGAQANGSVFIILARINKLLGGTTTPSDNIFTLLAKQNRLLGGSGAVASDTVFTLLAKNSKLLHH